MIRVILFLYFTISYNLASSQLNSGFLKGDKELGMFLEKKLINLPFDDATSYIFTTAILVFDHKGAIDTVKFMTNSHSKLRSYLTKVILETKQMWDTSITKNILLLIPFEIIKLDSNENIIPIQNSRMLSHEFLSLFKNNHSLNTILLSPIINIQYPPSRKEVF